MENRIGKTTANSHPKRLIFTSEAPIAYTAEGTTVQRDVTPIHTTARLLPLESLTCPSGIVTLSPAKHKEPAAAYTQAAATAVRQVFSAAAGKARCVRAESRTNGAQEPSVLRLSHGGFRLGDGFLRHADRLPDDFRHLISRHGDNLQILLRGIAAKLRIGQRCGEGFA